LDRVKVIVSKLPKQEFVMLTEDGFKFFIRKGGDELFICNPLWEEEVRKYFQPDKDDIVIDVGAHTGTYAIRLAKKAKLVIAVEPHPSTFQVLKYNIKLNCLDNVLAVNVGLGKKNGIMYIDDKKGYGLTKLRNVGKKIVKVYTLDSLMSNFKIHKLDWLKIDTEGMEYDILQGASKTLHFHNPKLIIEMHKNKSTILKFLEMHGYKIKFINKNHIYGER
jgi:FkbM family methyltransferase